MDQGGKAQQLIVALYRRTIKGVVVVLDGLFVGAESVVEWVFVGARKAAQTGHLRRHAVGDECSIIAPESCVSMEMSSAYSL